jgi:hypothetical protein
MPSYSRDHEEEDRRDRARRRGLDYLLGRDDDRRRARSRPADELPDRGGRAQGRDAQPAGLRVSEPESFDVPCQTEVRAATGETRRCGAPAREYRVYMNNKWERWVICTGHAAYYKSWGADLSVLVD